MTEAKRIAKSGPVLTLLTLVSCGLVMVGAVPANAENGSGRHCLPAHTVDYLAHVQDLPAIHHVPANGKLPFGPSDVQLIPESGLLASGPAGGLLSEGNQAGFNLTGEGLKPSLGWLVTMQMTEISGATGKARRVVAERRVSLKTPRAFVSESVEIKAQLKPRPAWYRATIVIYGKHHERLGRYAEYIRGVRPDVHARLTLREHVASPGDIIDYRVQNPGTTNLAYGSGVTLDVWTGSGWAAPPGPSEFYFPVALVIGGGAVGECEGEPLPDQLAPGQYRVTKEVQAGHHSLNLRQYFSVE